MDLIFIKEDWGKGEPNITVVDPLHSTYQLKVSVCLIVYVLCIIILDISDKNDTSGTILAVVIIIL